MMLQSADMETPPLLDLFNDALAFVDNMPEHKPQPISADYKEKFAAGMPACVMHVVTELPGKSDRVNLNTLVINVVNACHAAVYTLDHSLHFASNLIENYADSATYNTPEKRRQHFKDQWHWWQGKGGFQCGYIKGLGLPGSAFDCKRCNIFDGEKGNRSTFSQLGEFMQTVDSTDWLIEGISECKSLVSIFGATGHFKTFMALDQGLCVASGKDWHGHAVKQGAVFYVAGEGKSGLSRRLASWAKQNRVSPADVPFFICIQPTSLTEADTVKALREDINAIAPSDLPPAMIIFDTLNRNFGPGDENSTLDMTKLIKNVDQYFGDMQVLIIHHSGLQDKNRSRGNTAFKGALDAEYKLESISGTKRIIISNTKMKDAEPPVDQYFEYEKVAIDDAGEIESLVLNLEGDQRSMVPAKGMTQKQRTALRMLQQQYSEQVMLLKEAGHDPKSVRISLDEWRKQLVAEEVYHEKSVKGSTEKLIGKGYVSYDPPFVLLPKKVG